MTIRAPLTLFSLIICASLTSIISQSACAQGKPADYERADNLQQRVRGKVLNGNIAPTWIGQSNQLWYRKEIRGGGSEFVLVDAAKGTRGPAFDHAKLAAALSKELERAVTADKLPVELIDLPEAGVLRILVGEKTYQIDLASYELKVSDVSLRRPTPGQGRRPVGGGGIAPFAPRPTSADGKWEAKLRESNVFLRNTATDAETQLTKDGSSADAYEGRFYWSPDSSRLVVMKTIPAQEHKVTLVESSPRDQEQPKIRVLDYLKPGDKIAHPRPRLFDVASAKEIPVKEELFPEPWSIDNLRWKPDSSRFTFLYNQRGHQVMRVVAVDAKSGETRALIDEQAKTFIDWTNKVFFRASDSANEAIWMSERDGWNHLYLIDWTTGAVKNPITKGEWVVRSVDRVDEEKRQIWFQAGGIRPGQDPYYIHFCRVNFDGSGLTILTEGDGTHTVNYSADRQYFVDTYSRVDMPPVTEVRRTTDGGKVMDIEKADAGDLQKTGWQYPERFVSKARDGKTDIYGVIVRPTKFDPKRKYPVIENIYAGPQGAFVPKAFSTGGSMQSLAELGFIVVQMDGMGTNYRSKAFHDVCWKNLGDAGFPDRILWIKTAAAKYTQMDLTRVGIYGTSAGGQNALGGLLQHGDFYKAGMADCGCHDNRMDKIWWNEQWMGYPIGPHYAEQSNVTMAPRLTGKLLLMVGEMDTNVDPASTYQVVNALLKAGKDFDLFVAPGAGHGVVGTPTGRRKLQDFFVRNLLGVEPPNRNAVAVSNK